MVRHVLLLALAVGVSATELKVTWSDCGDSGTHGTVSDLEPPTITTGEQTTLSGTGNVDIDVPGGNYRFVMKAGFITLLDHTGDLCTAETINLPLNAGSIEWVGLNCPQSAGGVTVEMKMTLSSSVPSMMLKTDSTLTATNGDDKLLCVTIHTAAQDETVTEPMALDHEWIAFKMLFDRHYSSEEHERARYWIFKNNVEFMKTHNAKGSTYRMGVNDFSDMTPDEFAEAHFGFSKPAEMWPGVKKLGTYHAKAGEVLASAVDWTTQGAVTPVKNQGQCGSCWSFSTTGALEGAWQIATGTLVSVSEQQFVDCSKQNSGCSGGLMDYAFSYAEGVSLCTEDSYSYTASDGTCHTSGCTIAIPHGGVTGYHDVAQNDESALQSAVTQQPVSVAIEADKSAFQSYTSGVLQGNCGTQLDHGVLCVGFGTDNGVDYWKVKNSWGGSWGESGYVRMLRGKGGSGECGILESASYPNVNGAAPPSPSPSPSPSPAPTPSCSDTSGMCSLIVQLDLCNVFYHRCLQSCGCCDATKPSYCPGASTYIV